MKSPELIGNPSRDGDENDSKTRKYYATSLHSGGEILRRGEHSDDHRRAITGEYGYEHSNASGDRGDEGTAVRGEREILVPGNGKAHDYTVRKDDRRIHSNNSVLAYELCRCVCALADHEYREHPGEALRLPLGRRDGGVAYEAADQHEQRDKERQDNDPCHGNREKDQSTSHG